MWNPWDFTFGQMLSVFFSIGAIYLAVHLLINTLIGIHDKLEAIRSLLEQINHRAKSRELQTFDDE